jgi:outer membrane protein OmpA-like peptidoglycan-associated protein/tetratricopeptide (TPR) repeat protein
VVVDLKSMARRWYICGLMLFILQGSLWSQEDVKINRGSFKTGIDTGFKEAWASVKEGDSNFRDGKGTYDLARDHYLYALQYNPAHAALNYKLAICYLYTDNKYEAINYLIRAYTSDPEVSGDIHLMLGTAYQLVLEFDKAIEHFKLHSQALEPEEREAYATVLTKRLSECQNGRELSKNPQRVVIRNLGEAVNSKYDDYNPVFAYGDSALFFTSRRPFEKSERNKIDNKFNEDIYLSARKEGLFHEAVRLPDPFNSDKNDAVVGLSAQGDSLILYQGHIDGGDIQITIYKPEKARWSRPKSVTGRLTSKEGETSASFSPDGNEIYFVSGNSDLSMGGKDILYSKRDHKGKWVKPVNLGSTINTAYDEEGVFLTPDGNYLYFASMGHNSMGGFDIFRSERRATGIWSAPENLGYPINTPDDEVFYITDRSGNTGYYSAIREGGLGAKDIFKVVYLGSEKELIFRTSDQLVAGPGVAKTGFLIKAVPLVLDSRLLLTGHVLDTVGKLEPIVAKMAFFDPATGKREAFVISDSLGEYTARLPEPKTYAVEINAAGYLYFLDIIDLSTETGDEKIQQSFFLKKVEVGTKVVLDHIFFETGKAVLRPESYDALDQVFRFLENNPSMRLEISGHTDNTGTLRINQRLSRDRAKAVVDYLVNRGISQEMLVSQGYADTQPVAPNNTSEGREQNRRVEFKVLSK